VKSYFHAADIQRPDMKRSIFLGMWLVAVSGAQVLPGEAAPVTLTVQSYRALTNAVIRVVDTVAPGAAEMWLADLRAGLGLSELKGIDLDRPWQMAVWIEGIQGAPSISVRIPTTNFEAFKAGLSSDSVLRGFGQPNAVQSAGDYANIWLQMGQTSGQSQANHSAWNPEDLAQASTVLGLEIKPGEPLREQMIAGLGMARMMIMGTMMQQGQNVPGVDAQVMGELMGAYFDVFQTGLRGLETLQIGLDLKADALAVTETVVAKADSELASWLDAGQGSLESVMPAVRMDQPLAIAMRWDKASAFMPTLKKFARLGLQLQGAAVSEAAVKEMDELIDAAVPLRFGGSMEFKEGFVFSGMYEFPGRDLGRVYELMRGYVEGAMQQQVGDNQLYRSIQFTEAARKVNGLPVDRLTMEINLDAPLYQMPGQKEMIERMWPGGKMMIDQARQANRLLVNILQLLPAVLQGNPMVPEEVATQLRRADSAGTEVSVQVDVIRSGIQARSIVPLKLFQSVAQVMQ